MKTKTFRFKVQLIGVGPKSKKKLMECLGLDESLTIDEQEIEFADIREQGWGSPLFLRSIMEKQDELIAQNVKCVFEEVKRKEC